MGKKMQGVCSQWIIENSREALYYSIGQWKFFPFLLEWLSQYSWFTINLYIFHESWLANTLLKGKCHDSVSCFRAINFPFFGVSSLLVVRSICIQLLVLKHLKSHFLCEPNFWFLPVIMLLVLKQTLNASYNVVLNTWIPMCIFTWKWIPCLSLVHLWI